MSKPTLQLQLKQWLESLGYKEIPCQSSKYICMQRYQSEKGPDQQRFYFLGKNGAFRCNIGPKPVASKSTMIRPNKVKFTTFRKEKGWL